MSSLTPGVRGLGSLAPDPVRQRKDTIPWADEIKQDRRAILCGDVGHRTHDLLGRTRAGRRALPRGLGRGDDSDPILRGDVRVCRQAVVHLPTERIMLSSKVRRQVRARIFRAFSSVCRTSCPGRPWRPEGSAS